MKSVIVRVKADFIDHIIPNLSTKKWFDANKNKLVALSAEVINKKTVYFSKSRVVVYKFLFTIISDKSIQAEIFKDVSQEIIIAKIKYPSNKFMMAALTEEVGESAQAMIDHSFGRVKSNCIYEELIQVMAVATRLILEGSEEFKFQGLRKPNGKSVIVETPSTSSVSD